MGSKRCSIIEESKKQAFPFFMTGGIESLLLLLELEFIFKKKINRQQHSFQEYTKPSSFGTEVLFL